MGSTFTVSLALPIAATNVQLSATSGPRLHPGLKKMKLLVIDDDNRLYDILVSAGLHVKALQLASALPTLAAEKFDIVLVSAASTPLDKVFSNFCIIMYLFDLY